MLRRFPVHLIFGENIQTGKNHFFDVVFKNIEKTSVKIYIFVSVIAHGNH